MSTLNAKVILNVKTAAEWANSMEILLEGELGIESDTRLIKVGNGVDTYISLPYTAASDINDIEGVTVTNPTDGNVLTYSNGEWVNITPSSLPADTDLSHYDNSTSGFITASDIPALPADTDLSHYDNTNSDFATVSQIPTDVSQLNNDAGYITSADLPTVGDGTITIQKNSVNVDNFTTNQNTNKTINITVPTLLSELTNDVGYLTTAVIPTVNNGTLTIKQDGVILATFTANSANDAVVNITGGGGGGGGGASYTSQLTVDSGLTPDTNAVYDLGSNSFRWANGYINTLYATAIQYPGGNGTLQLGDRSSHGMFELDYGQVGSSASDNGIYFAPNSYWTGNTSSIGTSSKYFGYGYFNNMYVSNLKPRNNVGTADIGTSTYPFDDIYGKKLHASTSLELNGTTYTSIPAAANNATLTIQKNSTDVGTFTADASSNVTIDISVPTDTNDLTNGAGYITSSSLSSYLPLTGGTMTGNITVSGSGFTLGNSTQEWNTVYTSQVTSNSNALRVGGNSSSIFYFAPTATATKNVLGSSSSSWEEAYIDQFNASSGNTSVSFDTNVLPKAGATYDLGSPTTSWSKGYIYQVFSNNIQVDNTITLGTDSGRTAYIAMYDAYGLGNTYMKFSFDGLTCVFAPISNNAAQLGDASNGWKHIYANGATITGDVVPGNGSYKLGDSSSHWTEGWINDLYLGAGTSHGLYFSTDTSHTYIRDVTGNTLYLHATGSTQIGVNGVNRFVFSSIEFRPTDGNVNLGASGQRWSTIYYNGGSLGSDYRLKDNIIDLESGLDIINDLEVKSYTLKNNHENVSYGIIAQEAVVKRPELVSIPKDEDDYYGVHTQNIMFASVRAIQELSSKVDELNAKIKVLEAKL